MTCRMRLVSGRLAVCAAMSASGNAAAQATIPRTADGRPDLQGIWNNGTQTPLERPVALGNKAFYTDEELKSLQGRDHDAPPREGDPGAYNQFWWDEGGFL